MRRGKRKKNEGKRRGKKKGKESAKWNDKGSSDWHTNLSSSSGILASRSKRDKTPGASIMASRVEVQFSSILCA